MMVQGQFDGSIAELRTADDLDPLSPAAAVSVGLAYYMARRYDDALKQFEKVQHLYPDRGAIHPFIGAAYEAKGQFGKAMAEYQLALNLAPAGVRVRIAHLDAVMGKREEARNLLKLWSIRGRAISVQARLTWRRFMVRWEREKGVPVAPTGV